MDKNAILRQLSDMVISKHRTAVRSTSVEPGDFLRVRLLHVHEQHGASDAETQDNSKLPISGIYMGIGSIGNEHVGPVKELALGRQIITLHNERASARYARAP